MRGLPLSSSKRSVAMSIATPASICFARRTSLVGKEGYVLDYRSSAGKTLNTWHRHTSRLSVCFDKMLHAASRNLRFTSNHCLTSDGSMPPVIASPDCG